MRREMVLLASIVVAAGDVHSARAAAVGDFIDFSLRSGATTLLPGRLYVPPESVTDPLTKRPFILFLHGAGESGTNNAAQINVNIDNLLAEAKRRGAFLYAPQTPSNWSSATLTDRAMTMINRAIAEQPVDANRLYVTGLSNGGGGAWNMLSRFPDAFAAGIPICGVNPASDFVPARLIDQHIAAFHARNDPVVSVAISRNVITSILNSARAPLPTYLSLRDATSTFVFTSEQIDLNYVELPTGGHVIWPGIYSEPKLYDWMFSHSLVPEPRGAILAALCGMALVAGRRRSAGPT